MTLYWKETGDQAAEALLFLHGAGLSSTQWEPQLEALSDYHCLAPDLPGNGRSPGPIDLEAIADALAARLLVRQIPGAQGVTVPGAGHVWNLEDPERFTALVRAWAAGMPGGAAALLGVVPF